MANIEKAYTPYRMRHLTVKNRFVRSAEQTFIGNTDGTLSEGDFAYYQSLIDGGVGTIILGHACVEDTYGKASDRQASLADDMFIADYERLAEMARPAGTRLIAQLSHTGGRSTLRTDLICPSVSEMKPGLIPREMTVEEIHGIVASFADAAERAKRAGLDGVQLHAAHLYLLSQFSTPVINRRTDAYGGSPENRFRVIREIIAAIREKCGEDFPIMIKVNCNAPANLAGCNVAPDKNAAARVHADESYDRSYWEDICYVVEALDELGVEAIEVSGYDFLKWNREAHLFYLEEVKQLLARVKQTTLFLVGGVLSPEDVETLLDSGMELISICRAFRSEADIMEKFREGKSSRCIHCNQCFGVPYSKNKVCVFHPDQV